MKVKNTYVILLPITLGVLTSCVESNVTNGHEWVDLRPVVCNLIS